MEVDPLWEIYWEGIGYGGAELGAYVSDGLVVLPCGKSFDEEKGDEPINCGCKICSTVMSGES